MKSKSYMLTIAMVMLLGRHAVGAITLGQIDDFEDGTTQGWREGFQSPNPTNHIGSGGPTGVGDAFVENVSSGSSSVAGGKQVMFNRSQWSGDYVSGGIKRIFADMTNLGSNPMSMRIAIKSGSTRYGSTSATILPADGIWRRVSFGLNVTEMSMIKGAAALDTALSNVSELRMLSASTGPKWKGDAIAATLGVDNITASPNGDFDGDGDVDGDDFLLWQRNFPILDGTADSLSGDANADGNVDGDDFLIWQSNFPFPISLSSIPEPHSLVLLAMGTTGVLGCRRQWPRQRMQYSGSDIISGFWRSWMPRSPANRLDFVSSATRITALK